MNGYYSNNAFIAFEPINDVHIFVSDEEYNEYMKEHQNDD